MLFFCVCTEGKVLLIFIFTLRFGIETSQYNGSFLTKSHESEEKQRERNFSLRRQTYEKALKLVELIAPSADLIKNAAIVSPFSLCFIISFSFFHAAFPFSSPRATSTTKNRRRSETAKLKSERLPKSNDGERG
jgi:hypothetical protein